VAALAAYGTALAALSKSGEYDGANLKDLGEKASGTAKSLGAAEGPAAAIQPAGNIVAGLATMLFHTVSERKLKGYVLAAEPVVQALLQAMGAYVRALGNTLTTTDDVRAAVIRRAEKGTVTSPVDPARLVQFFQLAGQLDDEGRHAREALDGYASVLARMAQAHTALARASADGAGADDAKNVLGAVADLLEQIKALRVALGNKEWRR
jgi:hypothetical protein